MGYNSIAEQYGSNFIRLATVGSHICKIPQNSELEVRAGQGHPRSSILVSIESTYSY